MLCQLMRVTLVNPSRYWIDVVGIALFWAIYVESKKLCWSDTLGLELGMFVYPKLHLVLKHPVEKQPSRSMTKSAS